MARGGYRKPPARSGPGGPGRFSKRTDGQNPMKTTPGLENPDVEYGDVSKMRDALKIQGINPGRPQLDTSLHQTGAPTRNDQLPDFVTGAPSARPGEPITAGMDGGPGPGRDVLESASGAPDLRETTLEFLSLAFGNNEAASMLEEYRATKAQPAMGGGLEPAPPAGPMSMAPTLDETDMTATDDLPSGIRQPMAPEGEMGQPTEPLPGPQGDVEPSPADAEELVAQQGGQEA